MEINCEYYDFVTNTCRIGDANITEKDHEIKEIKGVHKEGKSHNDVRENSFFETNVNYFLRGIERHFPNLTHLDINRCGIKEISKNDLKGLEGLVSLYIEDCQLTSLPDDLFINMPNLRKDSFADNRIEFASSKLLKPLLGRENVEVDLRGNKKIDAWFWPGCYGSLNSLEELMKFIDEKCKKPAQPTVVPDPLDSNSLFKKMWLSGIFSDLIIIAGEKKFKVHKAILGMKNGIFLKILEDHSEAAEIKIPDFSANSVEALLKFIYMNEISKDGNAKDNFEIADKFKVEAMKSFYEKVIGEQIDDTNAWET